MTKRVLSEEQKEKARIRAKDWYHANKERSKKSASQWRLDNPEKAREKSAEYYQKNKETILEKRKIYTAKNVENLKAYHIAYEQANKEKRKAWRIANRERKKEIQNNRRLKTQGCLPKGIVQKLMRLQKGLCINCKSDLKKVGHHLDHIEPISKGGKNIESNVQLLCPTCNMKKHSKDPIVWANENGRLL